MQVRAIFQKENQLIPHCKNNCLRRRVIFSNYICLDSDSEGEVAIPYIPASDSGSRLQNEFAILKWLGKGGFGDVIKVL